MALARLANAPNQAAIALGGVLASFTLMVAMAIMVTSFRVSLDDWLKHILPADLYVRTAASGDTRGLTPEEMERNCTHTRHFPRRFSTLVATDARSRTARTWH